MPAIAHEQMRLFARTVEEQAKRHPMVRILEIGTGRGYSGAAFVAHSQARLVTIDAKAAPYGNAFEERLRTLGWRRRVKRIIGRSAEILPSLRTPYHIVYVDGDHSFDAVLVDLTLGLRLLTEDGVLFADDVSHPDYPGVTEAFTQFCLARPGLAVTVHDFSHGVAEVRQ